MELIRHLKAHSFWVIGDANATAIMKQLREQAAPVRKVVVRINAGAEDEDQFAFGVCPNQPIEMPEEILVATMQSMPPKPRAQPKEAERAKNLELPAEC